MNGLQKIHDNFKTKVMLEKDIKNLKWNNNCLLILTLFFIMILSLIVYQEHIKEDSIYKSITVNTYKESIIFNNCVLRNYEINPHLKRSIWCDSVNEYYGKPLSG